MQDRIAVDDPAKHRLYDLYLTSVKLVAVGGSPPTPLRLDFANCQVGDDGAEQLVGELLEAVSSTVDVVTVHSLDMRGNSLTDHGAQVLLQCVGPLRLRHIDARMNRVTPDGIASIAEYLRGLDAVTHVVVDESGRIEALGATDSPATKCARPLDCVSCCVLCVI